MIALDRCAIGDVREVLRAWVGLGVKVNCIVTSPPYWGLRSYLPAGHPLKASEIGSEPTLREFLATMVDVFDLCRQLLTDDGVCWVNMGDSYAGSWGAQGRQGESGQVAGRTACAERQIAAAQRRESRTGSLDRVPAGIKAKDLVGQPWRLAFALQDAGWYLRQDVIWAKPNPMPESVRDRCTKAHEYLFLLTKSERYWWDFEAMQEPVTGGANPRRASNGVGFGHGYDENPKPRQVWGDPAGKLPAGWATGTDRCHHEPRGRFTDERKAKAIGQGVGHREGPPGNPSPKQLLADTEAPGAYVDGKGERMGRGAGWRKLAEAGSGTKNNASMDAALAVMPSTRNRRSVWTVPTEPYTGAHFATFPSALIEPCILAGCPAGGVVLDPFMGSGTTAMVAQRLGRRWLGIDIDERNLVLQADRIGRQQALQLEAA